MISLFYKEKNRQLYMYVCICTVYPSIKLNMVEIKYSICCMKDELLHDSD